MLVTPMLVLLNVSRKLGKYEWIFDIKIDMIYNHTAIEMCVNHIVWIVYVACFEVCFPLNGFECY